MRLRKLNQNIFRRCSAGGTSKKKIKQNDKNYEERKKTNWKTLMEKSNAKMFLILFSARSLEKQTWHMKNYGRIIITSGEFAERILRKSCSIYKVQYDERKRKFTRKYNVTINKCIKQLLLSLSFGLWMSVCMHSRNRYCEKECGRCFYSRNVMKMFRLKRVL